MALPSLKLELTNNISGLSETGPLVYCYNSFYNLQNPSPSETQTLRGLNITKDNAEIEIDKPIQLETEVCYDDSVNLIITDRKNPPKIVNSRFYQTDSLHYKIADRKGNLDTNIYSEENFKIETSLIKKVRTITSLSFLGIADGGKMPVGNYTFYFKLADADGNETDFISESGKVVCHMGAVNNPESIRGGLLDEDSNKLIKFKLHNLDLAYDYINIYYTRSTGDPSQEVVRAYKIDSKFKITNNDTEIAITGYENHIEIGIDEINVQYASFNAVDSLANCQNISFAGNITNDYEVFKSLEELSLRITPQLVYDEEGIGNLSNNYSEQHGNIGGEYYNVNNIYYKLGYWDEEIYRFGIVYILNDYTLSPVFNIRGKKTIDLNTEFEHFDVSKPINSREDYIIENSDSYSNNPENIKGVFKIDSSLGQTSEEQIDMEGKVIFNEDDSIKPLGIKFNFDKYAIEGKSINNVLGLKDLTKGFFIVRQKRIPTILAQGIGIGTSEKSFIPVIKGYQPEKFRNNWFTEAFLRQQPFQGRNVLVLGSNYFALDPEGNGINVKQNALLCPEAALRTSLFNTYFNSSEFVLLPFKYDIDNKVFKSRWIGDDNFTLNGLKRTDANRYRTPITSSLTLIEPGISRLSDDDITFASKAGDESIAYKHLDPILGDFEDMNTPIYPNDSIADPTGKNNKWNTTGTKVRGIFNTYVGSRSEVVHGEYYNIYQKGYNFETKWKDYFKIRYNDSAPFFPVSDRIEWSNLKDRSTIVFRGDCYINTYTHRMNWNFIDPDLPTNKKIIDGLTWAKNFKITPKTSLMYDEVVADVVAIGTGPNHKKLLPLFTYIREYIEGFKDENVSHEDGSKNTIKEPTDKKYRKYADANGEFGYEKINRPDVNAVALGHWVTFKICSNVNLAMRDLDFGNPSEEALHRKKRGFYPLQAMDKSDNLPESNVINLGISKSLGNKNYFEIPDVPFIKTSFTNRIYYSNPLQNSVFTNGNRVFKQINYEDYTLEYGAIVKLVEWYGTLIVIMEHGIIMIPVNERALMTNAAGEQVYVNTDTILPKNPRVISNTFGSLWADSVIKTARFIYGIDTVAKKIWRTNGEKLEIISDMKIQKFLNENITLKETDRDRTINKNSIKTHYNAFKQDILFVFMYGSTQWHLCWNEIVEQWVTRYTWFPEFSENINNIFYTFASKQKHKSAKNKLYKHGYAGYSELTDEIKSTHWYDEQHPFEFEFVVNSPLGIQKIYDNMKIISNNVAPDSFIYEIIGDSFDWSQYKDLILDLNDLLPKNSDISVIGFGKPFPWLL